MPYSDITKQRKAQREHLRRKVIENPKWYQELKKRRKQKRENIHAIINHIKTTVGCLMCDEKDHDKLQFHHVLPDFKLATVAQLISNRSKIITVLKEIDKCVCVCTACHKQLDSNLSFVIKTVKNEKWYRDWSLKEALDWFQLHPQTRFKKNDFLGVIKAVVRNSQIQDLKKFYNVM
ncbi:MAG: hypothetical protein A2076_18995 [Geobacteraceae bacterium GWC2_53_11]|nr:MAG: hypothetical protein A2076_18995 [Geobacteraceae bacterium GWC2_53_11]